jgi:methylthioxylose transferase
MARMTVRLRALPAAAFAGMAVTVGVGLWLARHDGRELGVPYPPFIGRWDPAVTAWALGAVALFALAIWAAPRLLAIPPAAFALAVFALTLALRVALGAASRGVDQWSHVFDPASFEGPNEYLPALTALRYGQGFFLDRFAELVPALPVHAAGHPPGLLLTMDTFGITTPERLAALCIGGGALVAPLAYAVGRQVLDDRRARFAALLTATAPSILLFGATSADALYASLGLLAAWPLASRQRTMRIAGAVLLALVSLFAWSLLAIGAWAALLAWRRDGLKQMLALGLTCAAALLAVQGAFAALTGFDPIGTLRATEEVYRFGIAGERPYWFWLPGSPTAFLLMLGLPVAWLVLRALARGDDAAIAIFGVLAVAAVAGFTKAEVERIWLSFAPLVCLAAAGALPERHLRLVLALLGVHALAWEVLWNTVW